MVRPTLSEPPIPVVIAGPTASGKSALAMEIAALVDGEIVCADSRQVYAGMDIASAQPSVDDKAEVPHHMFAVIDPDSVYAAGDFVKDADRVIAEIQSRGKTPVVVGGTGLYLRCWRFGLSDVPMGDATIREQLEDERARLGIGALHEKLQSVDAASAARISPNDPVRIMRALEIHAVTGEKASALRRSHDEKAPRGDAHWLYMDAPREWLVDRIGVRTAAMFSAGIVDEAIALRARVENDNRLLKTLGVEEALQVVDGACTEKEGLERTIIRTRQYARRQRIWFQKETWWTRVPADDGGIRADAIQRILSSKSDA